MAEENSEYAARLRRTHSVTGVEEISVQEKKERSKQPDSPCHKIRDSLLSSSSGYSNYRGLLNLCIVLLVLSNARVALENIIKYGILVDPVQWFKIFLGQPSSLPSVLIILSIHAFTLISLGIEKALSKKLLSEQVGRALTIVHLTALFITPPVCVYVRDCHVVGASIALGVVSVSFFKLVSYHMVNFWCRMQKTTVSPTNGSRKRSISLNRKGGDVSNGKLHSTLVMYPDNLSIKDIYYFMFAPTLCYELNFPRSPRIRKRFLIKRIVEMMFLLQLMLGLVQQWIIPTINNSLKPLQEMNYSRMLERLLKLSVPNHFIWLIFFYWFFHSCMNATAEVLRFGDRHFYNDWWNAETVQYFWQNWNIPVHKWCVRHLYKPLLTSGFSKSQASLAVFLVSAFFHEYLVSVPLKMFRIWAFCGMVLQVPFAKFVNAFLHKQYGNMAVWLSLIIGQPLCILMYYHDYYVTHLGNMEASA